MNILFLMGNSGLANCSDYPVYLTEIKGRPIIEHQVEHIRTISPSKWIFCVQEQDLKHYHLDSVIGQLANNTLIYTIKNRTAGALCTALLAIDSINTNEELLIMAIDDFVEQDANDIIDCFRRKFADAGIVTFNSIHPRYSYVKLDQRGCPVEFSEKKPISRNALVSFYYFKNGCDFVSSAKDVIRKDNPINDNYYISQSLNEYVLCRRKIVVHSVPNEKFHPFKTEAQLAQYINEYRKNEQ